MKVVLVTGDRNWTDWERLYAALDEADPDILIEGEARGADKWSRNWAEQRGFTALNVNDGTSLPPNADLSKKRFVPMPAQWKLYGRSAGPIRNRNMAKLLDWCREQGYETEVIGFHNDIENSKGTKDMLETAEAMGFKTTLVTS